MSEPRTQTDSTPVPVRLREIRYFVEAEGGLEPNIVSMLGATDVGLPLLDAWRTAAYGGLLPHRLKELVRLRTTRRPTTCSKRGRDEGIDDETLAALETYEDCEGFSPRERLALWYADRFVADEVDSDDVFDTLRNLFSEEEMIELGKFCGLVQGLDSLIETMEIFDDVSTTV